MESEDKDIGYTIVLAQLIAANETEVTVECYLDDETSPAFEERIFDRKLLEGIVPMRCGALIIITVIKRVGEISYLFRNGEGMINNNIFYAESFTWKRC